MVIEPFRKSAWRPSLALHVGEDVVPQGKHRISDKQLADVVEAILGAALSNGGFNAGLRVATAMGIETYGIKTWDDARTLYQEQLPTYLKKSRIVPGLKDIEEIFGYKFRQPGYVEQALRHGSCPIDPKDPVPSYQRLEFIGDAVLEIEVAMWLWKTFPSYDPNRLTVMKSHLVRNKSLGALMESLKFHRHIRHFNSAIPSAMLNFSKELAFLKQRASKSDYYTDCDPPKFMSDILESTIGAIFLDNGMCTDVIRRIFHDHFLTRLDPDIDYSLEQPMMAVLVHHIQKRRCTEVVLRRSENVEHSTLDHKLVHKNVQPQRKVKIDLWVHDQMICSREAASVGLAKLRLAEAALEILLQGETDRILDICSCVRPQAVLEDENPHEDEFSF